jgi:O-antigen ligase
VPSRIDVPNRIPVVPHQPVKADSGDAPEVVPPDPLRSIAFHLGLLLVFLRISMLHQVQSMMMGFNLHLLYLFGIPAIIGVVAAGGLRRAFRGRPAYYWTGFAIWMFLAVPFSSYRRDSAELLLTYLRTDLIMLFVTAGLAVSWRECKQLMHAIAWGVVVNLMCARIFLKAMGYENRVSLEFGTISNPNDLAAHLLFALPFLLWVAMSSKFILMRIFAILGVVYGLYVILGTGSRGAVMGLGVATVYFLLRGTVRQRLALVAIAPIVAGVLLTVVPSRILQRLTSFSASSADAAEDAIASSMTREYLLKTSIRYTLQYPLFGVGPGQFSSFEGMHNQIVGTHGVWQEAHNTFTQVSSECGIPAAILFIAGIVSTFLLLNRTFRQARNRPDCADIRAAVFCVSLALLAFCTVIAFVNFAYFFYLPAMAGMAIAMSKAAQIEFHFRSQTSEDTVPVGGGFTPSPPMARAARQPLS